MEFGSLNTQAQELRVGQWIDAAGAPMERPLKLADLGDGYKVIYCFQHWCPSCHSRGFPTLKYLSDNLKDKGFSFAVIQTVFEGSHINTFDKLRVNQEQYGLKIPFGHDVPEGTDGYPTFMQDYRSGGTPWFTVINPAGQVVYADFRIDPVRFMKALANGIGLDTDVLNTDRGGLIYRSRALAPLHSHAAAMAKLCWVRFCGNIQWARPCMC